MNYLRNHSPQIPQVPYVPQCNSQRMSRVEKISMFHCMGFRRPYSMIYWELEIKHWGQETKYLFSNIEYVNREEYFIP